MPAEALAIENLLISHFDGHDMTMPPLPGVAEQVLRHLRPEHWSVADVAGEIGDDQVLAAAVLRMVNSPLYRGHTKITSLPHAVSRLGKKALRTLMMHQALRGLTFHCQGADRQRIESLWRRSLASGAIMRALSRFTNVGDERAFLIGLLHDIGNVICLRAVTREEGITHSRTNDEVFEYLCFESHQELGELVAQAWNLPDDLKSLISDHHAYPAADDPLQTERLQLQLSDMISAMLGYTPPVVYNLIESRAARDLGLADREDLTPFLRDLPDKISEAILSF